MMPEEMMQKTAEDADMIVNGYAFRKDGAFIRVFNLNDGVSAMVMDVDGTMTETNMCEIEQVIVKSFGKKTPNLWRYRTLDNSKTKFVGIICMNHWYQVPVIHYMVKLVIIATFHESIILKNKRR